MSDVKKSRKNQVKHLLLRLRIGKLLTRNYPKILVYHRFTEAPPASGSDHTIDASAFDRQLRLIKSRFHAVSLSAYWELRETGKLPPDTVVITVDDGYLDFYKIAYPLLKFHQLPATLFPTVGFVSGTTWLWPDRIKYALAHSKRKHVAIHHNGNSFFLPPPGRNDLGLSWDVLNRYCISLPDDDRIRFLRLLEDRLEVTLPHRPPEEFAPLSWEHLEEMSLNHVEIGCHTSTHPILSKIPVASLEMEILDAKREIEKRLGIPVTSFCYPNGRIGDINDDVVRAVRTAGFKVAVFEHDPDTIDDRYRQPRIGACRNPTNFEWKLDGYEILQQMFPDHLKEFFKVLTN